MKRLTSLSAAVMSDNGVPYSLSHTDREPSQCTMTDRFTRMEEQLSSIDDRLQTIEENSSEIIAMRRDIALMVDGFRWLRTAQAVFLWLVGPIISVIALLKWLWPSIRDHIK